MIQAIILDSGPLGLLTQRTGLAEPDACRKWMAGHIANGVRFIIPEIIDYELRRELLRAGKAASVSRLNTFNSASPGRYIPLNTTAMRLAADLWADIRRRGLPTADPNELDVDVILAAQAMT